MPLLQFATYFKQKFVCVGVCYAFSRFPLICCFGACLDWRAFRRSVPLHSSHWRIELHLQVGWLKTVTTYIPIIPSFTRRCHSRVESSFEWSCHTVCFTSECLAIFVLKNHRQIDKNKSNRQFQAGVKRSCGEFKTGVVSFFGCQIVDGWILKSRF